MSPGCCQIHRRPQHTHREADRAGFATDLNLVGIQRNRTVAERTGGRGSRQCLRRVEQFQPEPRLRLAGRRLLDTHHDWAIDRVCRVVGNLAICFVDDQPRLLDAVYDLGLGAGVPREYRADVVVVDVVHDVHRHLRKVAERVVLLWGERDRRATIGRGQDERGWGGQGDSDRTGRRVSIHIPRSAQRDDESCEDVVSQLLPINVGLQLTASRGRRHVGRGERLPGVLAIVGQRAVQVHRAKRGLDVRPPVRPGEVGDRSHRGRRRVGDSRYGARLVQHVGVAVEAQRWSGRG